MGIVHNHEDESKLAFLKKNVLYATSKFPIMHFICPEKILHNLCFSFLLGITAVPREIENSAYAKFLRANKVHFGKCGSFSFLSPKSSVRHLNSRNFFTDARYPDSFYGVSPSVIQRFNWHAVHLGLHEFLITTELRYMATEVSFPLSPSVNPVSFLIKLT